MSDVAWDLVVPAAMAMCFGLDFLFCCYMGICVVLLALKAAMVCFNLAIACFDRAVDAYAVVDPKRVWVDRMELKITAEMNTISVSKGWYRMRAMLQHHKRSRKGQPIHDLVAVNLCIGRNDTDAAAVALFLLVGKAINVQRWRKRLNTKNEDEAAEMLLKRFGVVGKPLAAAEGSHRVSTGTLFFMPECSKSSAEDIMKDNWDKLHAVSFLRYACPKDCHDSRLFEKTQEVMLHDPATICIAMKQGNGYRQPVRFMLSSFPTFSQWAAAREGLGWQEGSKFHVDHGLNGWDDECDQTVWKAMAAWPKLPPQEYHNSN